MMVSTKDGRFLAKFTHFQPYKYFTVTAKTLILIFQVIFYDLFVRKSLLIFLLVDIVESVKPELNQS